MTVIVVVVIEAERARRLRAEEPHVLGVLRDPLRHPEQHTCRLRHDPVALRHDDVQVVADEQHADPARLPQPPDERVELGLAGVVDAAHRLVEDEEVGVAQQRARKHDALQLAARELRELLIDDALRADLGEHVRDRRSRRPAEREEARHRHRDRAIEVEPLRGVADAQAGASVHDTGVGRHEPEQHAHERRLAGAVGPDQRDDLARPDVDRHVEQQGAAVALQGQATGGEEGIGIERRGGGRGGDTVIVAVPARAVVDVRQRSGLERAAKRACWLGLARHWPPRAASVHAAAAQRGHVPEISTKRTRRPEAGRLGSAVDVLEYALAVDLGHRAAMLAHEHDRPAAGHVVLMQAPAGEIGVAALQAMDDARLEQRLERAVDGDRREPRALLGEPAEDVVGPDRAGDRGDLCKHLLAQRREAHALGGERLRRPLDRSGEAARVVRPGRRECGLGGGFGHGRETPRVFCHLITWRGAAPAGVPSSRPTSLPSRRKA